jgi:DNA-binding LacI/PurR family transcriptional regulator
MNITDIANIVGVSPATVSNALNDRKGVSEETKQKILKTANELGYYKETNSNGNAQKSIRFVIYKKHGLVVADTPFFSSLLEGIENECRRQGYELLISHAYHSEWEDFINMVNTEYSQGIIILATEMCLEDLEPFRDLSIPLVLLDGHFKGEDFDCVLINNIDASYKATRYLVQNGHNQIGYLHSSVHINNFLYRTLGFRDALQDCKVQFNPKFDFYLEPNMEGAYRDMKSLLEQVDVKLPTAFFADNDNIAFGAMRALKEKKIRIPQDISIVGLDDMPFCEITSPRLTTIRVFTQDIASAAVRRLLQIIEGSNERITQKIEINSELIIRESVLQLKA